MAPEVPNTPSPLRYAVNAREYRLLHHYLTGSVTRHKQRRDSNVAKLLNPAELQDDDRAGAFRSSSRLFVATLAGLNAWESISAYMSNRRTHQNLKIKQSPLRSLNLRLALSLSTILYLHRLFRRFFIRLRLRLLNEKTKALYKRYPRLLQGLTSRISPSIGASLAGIGLALYPSGQLRVTIAVYVAARALEMLYNAADLGGYLRKRPWWFGSWLLFPLAQGQLLHAFVFDRDCFPESYGDFILRHSPTYVQTRPPNIAASLQWPRTDQIIDSIGEMARLRWPPFVSPILHPTNPMPLPPTIDPAISSITSRAHPSIPHLSCALIHPSEPSCFSAYLSHLIQSSVGLARFFALFYAAMALPRYKSFIKSPIMSLNHLAKTTLRTVAAMSGAIGTSWASICLFAAIFPRTFLSRFRFSLGGFLGGCFQFLDRSSAGKANSLYATRVSVDSFWKVGVKHGWWKGVKGGDVFVFIAGLALLNSINDLQKGAVSDKGVATVLSILRGDQEIALPENRPST